MTASPRFPRWFFVSAAGLLLATVVTAAFLVRTRPGSEPSRAAYERVKIGMTRHDAEAIFGEWPQRPVRRGAESMTVAWDAPDGGNVAVDFDSRDRVWGKQITEADTSLAGQARRLLRRLPLP